MSEWPVRRVIRAWQFASQRGWSALRVSGSVRTEEFRWPGATVAILLVADALCSTSDAQNQG